MASCFVVDAGSLAGLSSGAWKEKERPTDRPIETLRHRETETDRQTDRLIETLRQRETETDRQRETGTLRQRDRKRQRQTDRRTDRDAIREMGIEREREGHGVRPRETKQRGSCAIFWYTAIIKTKSSERKLTASVLKLKHPKQHTKG